MHRQAWMIAAIVVWGAFAQAQSPEFKPPAMVEPSPSERVSIRIKVEMLLRSLGKVESEVHVDDFASALIYSKAAMQIDRLGEFYTKNDAAMTLKVLAEGQTRAESLAKGHADWRLHTGARGYRSKVDGSIQPYIVVVPSDFKPDVASRLDVVLHGRNATLHEVRFLHDAAKIAESAKAPGLVLHVFGRTNNAYRWAGETDVFEAIDAVKREFRVDDNRVLLRGFSMGGAGAWHLGLQHPAEWAAVDAGAGFTETLKYAKQKDLPPWRRDALRIYDAVDYAENAADVPIAGYGGENDPQLQASENIVEALKASGVKFKTEGLVTTAEGIDFRRIVGKGMGHKVDPASESLLKDFRDERAARGIDRSPSRVRFVTYTLKFGRAAWFSVEGMNELYKKATVVGTLRDADDSAEVTTSNVSILAIDRPVADTIKLDGQTFPLREAVGGYLPMIYFRKTEKGWETLDYRASRALQENSDKRKRPGLQGPIDDAFAGPFLCVRGTGKPWNPQVQTWADARLEAFSKDWLKRMRGEVPVKLDTEITAEDIERHHLILFGDPGSNSVLAKMLKELPMIWTEKSLNLAGERPSANHVPVLISANPLNPRKYVVVNSGHTFRSSDFQGTNALLFPRLGDYAVFAVDSPEPLLSGYFDDRWRLPADMKR